MKKVTISDLSEIIAENNNMPSKSAEEFVKKAFSLISEYVIRDKIVKIKDLGTFKLVEVQERESIDVNTGERIMIPGHSKVSFTPDNSLRAQVNRPFADFHSVVLNEGVSLEEMEAIDVPPTEEDTTIPTISPEMETLMEPTPHPVDEEVSEGPEKEIVIEEHEQSVAAEEAEEDAVDEEPEEEEIVYETEEVEKESEDVAEESQATSSSLMEESKESTPHEETKVELPVSPTPQTVVYKFPTLWLLPYAFMTLILMAVSYFAGYHRLFNLASSEKDTPAVTVPKAKETKQPAKQIKEKPQPKEADSREKAIKEAVAKYPQVPGGAYLIVGTKKIREMKRGDTLLKMARQELGNSDLAQYIIVYNQFSNPDVIPLGYEVKIPELMEQREQ